MPYAVVFDPVAKPRENVRLVPKNEFYSVEYVEPVYGLLIDFGTIDADKEGSLYEVEELDLEDNQLGQFRIMLLDDFDLLVKQPRAAERGTTKTQSTRITPYLAMNDPTLKFTEFFVFGDSNRIYLQPINTGRQYSVYARAFIFGWKLGLKRLTETPMKYTDIPIATVTTARR